MVTLTEGFCKDYIEGLGVPEGDGRSSALSWSGTVLSNRLSPSVEAKTGNQGPLRG